ncbi:lipoprotein [Virgisporangium aliadipatigenens]|uniref:Lipoprotein n=1 Tax=Virgisporangium aliadipatigenens TaxID=741659 RepID=A0A8J3YSY8_9ACTN|nr:DUF4349 domain-containing protein [Virgisporangium aliadipatigenens]GIJ51119.1 lipoprotein [Virgisporangium aliadipatigenens]
MRSGRSLRLAAKLVTAGVLATLALTGCGADSKDSAQQSSAGAPIEADKPDDAAGAGPAQGGNQPAGVPLPEQLPDSERSIVYKGTLNVQVSDVDSKATEAVSLVRAAGGFVGADRRNKDQIVSTANLTLRVPRDRFAEVLDRLAKLGTETNRDVSAEDVTAQVVDLNSRIATQTASVERVRALLARAESIGEIVTLEAEVAKREAELESLKAKLNKLADLTALSTITLMLRGPEPDPSITANNGFLAGLKGGWEAFTGSLTVLTTVLGALLPFVVGLGLPIWLVVYLLRRRRDARRLPATEATGSPRNS